MAGSGGGRCDRFVSSCAKALSKRLRTAAGWRVRREAEGSRGGAPPSRTLGRSRGGSRYDNNRCVAVFRVGIYDIEDSRVFAVRPILWRGRVAAPRARGGVVHPRALRTLSQKSYKTFIRDLRWAHSSHAPTAGRTCTRVRDSPPAPPRIAQPCLAYK